MYFVSVDELLGGSVLGAASLTLPGYADPQRMLMPAAGATVYVYLRGGTTQADCFADQHGAGAPAVQPFSTDADGHVVDGAGSRLFTAQPVELDVAVSGGRLTSPQTIPVGGAGEGGAVVPRVQGAMATGLDASQTVDFAGTVQEVWLVGTLNANLTVTLTNRVAGCRLRLQLLQDSTGGRTLTVSDGVTPQAVSIGSTAGAYSEVLVDCPDAANVNVAEVGGGTVASGVELTSRKDQPSGYAGLDGGGKLQTSEFPTSAVTVVPPTGDTSGAGDLAAIQAQLNLGGVVRLRAGGLYTISTPNTKTTTNPSGSVNNSFPYGLQIPSNTTLDLNGATIKAAPGALGALICNQTMTSGGGDVNVGLISSGAPGIIDGNNNAILVNGPALVTIAWSTSPVCDNFRVQNGQNVGFWAFGNSQGQYAGGAGIVVANIQGGGFSCGQPYAAAMESRARVGRVTTLNMTPQPGNVFFNPGNGVYIVAKNSVVDTLLSINNTGGDKLDRPSQDVTIKQAFGLNNGDSGGNSGFKFQGGSSSATTVSSSPSRCEVGLVHMVNQNGAGLYMENSIDCRVGKYIGENNGLAGGYPDVWIGGIRDRIDDLYSDSAATYGVLVRQYAVDPSIGTCRIRNPNQLNQANIVGLTQAGASLTVGDFLAVDELPPPTNTTATAAVGGGSFAGGVTFSYVVTYLNAQGETTPSPEVSAAPVASGSVVLTWGTGALPTGVTGVKVYRATTSGGEYTSPALVATLGTVLTYTDTGSAVSTGAAPTLNTASTQKMKYGLQQTNVAATAFVGSLKVIGAATARVSAGGGILQAAASGGQTTPTAFYLRPKTGNVTPVQPAQGTLSAMPLPLGSACTIATIGVSVTTAGQAGALYRLGIYADDGNGRPGLLLVDADTVAADAIAKVEATVGLYVPAGRYHLAAVPQNCATTAPLVNGTTGTVDPPIPLNTLANAWLTNQNCWSQTGVTGALPTTWGTPVQGGAGVIPAIKVT